MPITSEVTKRYGPSGLGEMRVLEKSGKVKIVAASGDVYEIPIENVAEGIPLESKKNIYWQLDRMETQLVAVRPWDGVVIVQFNGFTRSGSDEPKVKVRPGGWREGRGGGQYYAEDRPRFTTVLKVVAGTFKGHDLLYGLDYLFANKGDGTCKIAGSMQKWVANLIQFLDLAGLEMMNDTIPWSANVLPWLEKELLERAPKNQFQATIEKGWPVAINRLPTGVTVS